MLQNITREYQQQTDNEKSKINYSEIVKRLFTRQNIIIYILTVMISTVSFGTTDNILIAPFGLAIVAAAVSARYANGNDLYS